MIKTILMSMLLILFSNASVAQEEEVFDPTELYIVALCQNTSLFVEQIAFERDNGRHKRSLQITLLRRSEANNRITTSEMLFGVLLIEMIYDRKTISPTTLKQLTYSNCFKTYTRRLYE